MFVLRNRKIVVRGLNIPIKDIINEFYKIHDVNNIYDIDSLNIFGSRYIDLAAKYNVSSYYLSYIIIEYIKRYKPKRLYIANNGKDFSYHIQDGLHIDYYVKISNV